MSRSIAVLGMHRSGTSCATGLLEEAGVFLGAVATQSPSNAKGNRENPRIMALHAELLRLNGGDWDAPPSRVAWTATARMSRDDIIGSYCAAPVWGFKDPRTLLVLDGWLEALPDLELIGVFRHPLLVAESLQRRNGFSLDKGLALWLTYNEALLAYHGRRGFPVVSFDGEPFTDTFARLVDRLGLTRPADGAWAFFDPDLRHAAPSTALPLPRPVLRAYRALQEIAL